MATIRKRRGKYSVSIRRLFHKPIYKTFSKYEDGKRSTHIKTKLKTPIEIIVLFKFIASSLFRTNTSLLRM